VVGLDNLQLHPDLRLTMMREELGVIESGLAKEVIALEVGTFDAGKSRYGLQRVASVHTQFFLKKRFCAQRGWELKKHFHQLVGPHESQSRPMCKVWVESEGDTPPPEWVEAMKATGSPAELPPKEAAEEVLPMPPEMAEDYMQDADRSGAPRRV
jgi:hypothetical protein